jgi:hypothetical protein
MTGAEDLAESSGLRWRSSGTLLDERLTEQVEMRRCILTPTAEEWAELTRANLLEAAP